MAVARVVGLGLCVVDHLYVVEDLWLAAPRTRFTDRHVSSGGMIGTALAQAAALGCNTHALSVLGDDAEAHDPRPVVGDQRPVAVDQQRHPLAAGGGERAVGAVQRDVEVAAGGVESIDDERPQLDQIAGEPGVHRLLDRRRAAPRGEDGEPG